MNFLFGRRPAPFGRWPPPQHGAAARRRRAAAPQNTTDSHLETLCIEFKRLFALFSLRLLTLLLTGRRNGAYIVFREHEPEDGGIKNPFERSPSLGWELYQRIVRLLPLVGVV